MKLTEARLKQIIEDELRKVLDLEQLKRAQQRAKPKPKKKKKQRRCDATEDELRDWCSKQGLKSFRDFLSYINAMNAAEKGKLFTGK